jgi:hypothetical protein
MPKYCVMCGSPIPDNQGSNTCSMCYGDPDHGKDGYYRKFLEQQEEEAAYKKAQEEAQWREEMAKDAFGEKDN